VHLQAIALIILRNTDTQSISRGQRLFDRSQNQRRRGLRFGTEGCNFPTDRFWPKSLYFGRQFLDSKNFNKLKFTLFLQDAITQNLN